MTSYLKIFFLLLSLPLTCYAQLESRQAKPVEQFYQEQLHVNTNGTFFLTGETILFKVSSIDSYRDTLSRVSRIAYVECIDWSGKPVLQTKINLKQGQGNGDFFFPSTMPTGNYTLIAYTTWMKNFSPQGYFSKVLTVINPFRKPDAIDAEKAGAEPIISFYTNDALVAGILNEITYVATTGKIQGKSVSVVDQNGSRVVNFNVPRKGKGSFSMTPARGMRYKAIISDSLQNVYFSNLPDVTEDGITFSVEDNVNQITLRIMSTNGNRDSTVMVNVFRNGIRLQQYPVRAIHPEIVKSFFKEELPEGSLNLILANTDGKILDRHDIDNHWKQDVPVSLLIDNTSYTNRAMVQMHISNLDSAVLYASVSVRLKDPFPQNLSLSTATIRPHNLLLKSGAASVVKHFPDLRGEAIQGTMLDANTKLPLKNAIVYLTISGAGPQFYTSVTDSNGWFIFHVGNQRGSKIKIRHERKQSNDVIIQMEDEFLHEYNLFLPPPFALDTSMRKFISQRNVYNQIENNFYAAKQDSVNEDNARPFFGDPDVAYNLDDYTRFPSMEDVFREYIPKVTLTKRGNKFLLYVFNTPKRNLFNTSPLCLVDGIPVPDMDSVMSINPMLVKTIELVTRRYYYGPLVANGIINIRTYKGEGLDMGHAQSTSSFTPLQPEKKYYAPIYRKGNQLDRIPDYRVQLFWQPDIQVAPAKTKSLSFYTSDINGEFILSLDGISSNGRRIHLEKSFTVGPSR